MTLTFRPRLLPDLRRPLDIAHPLAIYVRGADVEAVAVQNEPDRDFVRLPGLASCSTRRVPGHLPLNIPSGSTEALSRLVEVFQNNRSERCSSARCVEGNSRANLPCAQGEAAAV